MNFNIKTHQGKERKPQKGETIFYIQNKGLHSGRPLKKPIPNCWEVSTFRSVDFEILSIVFESRILEPFIIGSVIPFIRLRDYKNIIRPILEKSIHENRIINKHYLKIRQIDENIQQQEKIKKLLLTLKKQFSNELLKKI